MLIKKADPRWFLAQQAARDLRTTGLLPDEMPVVIIGGQLAMFVEVLNDYMRDVPRAFIFWRWANSFEPVATFSTYWHKTAENSEDFAGR
jgi:hypothetical protein